MLMTCIQPCFAATMEDMYDRYGLDNTYSVGTLPVTVLARKSGTSDEYTAETKILSDALKAGVGVDYKATLDMTSIKALFNKAFIERVLADGEAQAEFYRGKVTTDVTVKITYPRNAVANDNELKTAGGLDNTTFQQVGDRTIGEDGDNKVATIKYKNTDNLTVQNLVDNDSHLANITFTLNDAIKYNSDGYHKVSVSLKGTTTIEFDNDVKQFVKYDGASSHIVSAATEHVLVVIPAKPATCTEGGKTEGVKCETHEGYACSVHGVTHTGYDCGINGTVEPQATAPLAHKINGVFATVKAERVEPTCTENGIAEHWVCTLCKVDFKDAYATPLTTSITIPKLGHNTEISIAGHSATCTMDGQEATTMCSRCGFKSGGKIISAAGHNIVQDAAIPATCTTPGKTAGKHCSNCDYKVEQVDIAALGHKFGDWVERTPATESSTGLLERTCERGCGTTETQIIPQKVPAHVCAVSDALAKIIPATCDTPGSKQNYCECGQPVGAAEVIPATGHNLTEVAAKAATCTDKGLTKHYKCSTCGKLFRDSAATDVIQSAETPIDINNHGTDNIVILSAVAATCDADGWTEGTKCGKCNIVIVKQERIAKAHTLELVASKAATCEEAGVIKHWHCKVCNKDFADDKTTEMSVAQYTISPLGHIWGDVQVTQAPTEQAEGVGRKYCTRDSSHYEDVVIAKLKHIHNETVYKLVTPATCTTDGKEEKVYTCCNDPYTGDDKYRTIPAQHTFVDVAFRDSTCREEGIVAHKYCTVCNKRFDPVTGNEITEIKIGKKPHEFHSGNVSPIPGVIEKMCDNCGEIIRIKSNTDKAKGHENNHANKVKGDREDAMTEKDHKNAEANNQKLKVESEMTIDETGLSKELDDKIQNKDKAVEEKVVLDIVVKTINTFVDENNESIVYDQKKEIIEETEEYFEIVINIPESMRNKNDYRVYRMHKGTHTNNDIITETENFYGEKIVSIDHNLHTVTIKVRRFSEYVLVAYTEQQPEIVYPDPDPTPSYGGGGSSSYTIKLNVNGGVVLNNIVVKRGEKIELPIPTRDGYVFAGWFTESTFNTPFDANTAINRNYVLYAKWIEAGKCEGTVADNCPCLKYNDLNPELWYHEGVDYVLNNGMMIGTGDKTFEPDSSVTRAMLVTVLWRAEGKPVSIKDSTFDDLKAGEYYVEAVEWAAENGIVNGYSDTEFAPDDAIAREQIAAIMFRYAGHKGYYVSVGENTNILSYTDYSQISEYAIPAMQWAAGSGLMTGRTNSTLNPQADTTRAELATILYRFFATKK